MTGNDNPNLDCQDYPHPDTDQRRLPQTRLPIPNRLNPAILDSTALTTVPSPDRTQHTSTELTMTALPSRPRPDGPGLDVTAESQQTSTFRNATRQDSTARPRHNKPRLDWTRHDCQTTPSPTCQDRPFPTETGLPIGDQTEHSSPVPDSTAATGQTATSMTRCTRP